jgi:hypothetical protein
MIAGLVRGNAAADAGKNRLLETTRGAAQLDVPDAELTIALRFVPGALTITGEMLPGTDVRITADSDTLMGLSTVPLRLGLPNPGSPDGRAVVGKMLTRELKIAGLPLGLGLLTRLNRLLNVA